MSREQGAESTAPGEYSHLEGNLCEAFRQKLIRASQVEEDCWGRTELRNVRTVRVEDFEDEYGA